MKKVLSLLLVISLVLSLSMIGISAEDKGVSVYVTIVDGTGALVVAGEQVIAADTDGDGSLTISDVLYTAHELFYEGGAAEGYGTYVSEYGPGINKLWGDTCGSYGYYVNNLSAWNLADPVKDGDYVAAFVYTDLKAWSDHYSYFDRAVGDVYKGEAFTLTYTEAGYDDEWNPVTLPVEGATVTVNGEATECKTDAEGKATVTLDQCGVYTVSAAKEGRRLVAPVFIATVTVKPADVYVTVADENGSTAVAAEKISVVDMDKDEALTINDVLITAHELFYEGGAAEGYGTYVSEYGLGINKLWGSTCGSYGYYVNNLSAWSLADPVKDGDYVAAFVYTDLKAWSDHYSYFDRTVDIVYADEAFTLTYTEAGYDGDWNPVTLPVEGATITVDGEATEYKTDAEGKATVTLTETGKHIISAAKEGKLLVAPVFIANVRIKPTLLGDADGDGAVTILDATRIQRRLADLVGDEDIDRANADADQDGLVTIIDATRIQRFLADLITEL